ncbi:hypothetical protein [Capnocytophaga sputigena]|uniref:hypothetical protein n=1 Tax=Capnocytophaga sputigena TaxID=1019 RepID=UPI0028D29D29|nr:hypothetical protein [Capnocytophaga sputigena]
MKYFIIFFLVLLSTGCNLFQGQQLVEENVVVEEKQQQEEVFVPVQKELYVIKEGAIKYKIPDINVKTESQYSYGEPLWVVGVSKHFYKCNEGNEEEYILKEDADNYEKLKLTQEELEESNFILKGRQKNSTPGSLSTYLSISLITKEEYQKAIKNKVDFFIRDTLTFQKKGKVLSIACEEAVVKFKDTIGELSGVDESYEYIGRIDTLNQYVVSSQVGEDGYGEIIIDKTTGRKNIFYNRPLISPNRKHLLMITTEIFSELDYFSLYKVESITPFVSKPIITAELSNWKIYNIDENDVFFSKNGYLYASINPINSFLDSKGELNKQRMYIKIGIRN